MSSADVATGAAVSLKDAEMGPGHIYIYIYYYSNRLCKQVTYMHPTHTAGGGKGVVCPDEFNKASNANMQTAQTNK